MQYRAICPACGQRLPRSGYFRPHHQCPACKTVIKPDPAWDRAGNMIGAITLGLLVIITAFLGATFGRPGWIIGVATFVALLALGYVLYPYFTPHVTADHDLHAGPEARGFPVQFGNASARAGAGYSTAVSAAADLSTATPPKSYAALKSVVGLVLIVVAAVYWYDEFSRKPQAVPSTGPAATTPTTTRPVGRATDAG